MTKYSAVCIVVLLGCLLGCQKAQLEPDAKQTAPPVNQDGYLSSMHFNLDINVADLPDLITSAFDQLGITIDKTNQQAGQYECDGKSLSGASVSVKAYALIIGKSVLTIGVRGQKYVSGALAIEVKDAIAEAFRHHVRENETS